MASGGPPGGAWIQRDQMTVLSQSLTVWQQVKTRLFRPGAQTHHVVLAPKLRRAARPREAKRGVDHGRNWSPRCSR